MKRPEDATRAPTERPSQRDPGSRRAVGGFALASMLPMGLLAASTLLAACNLDNPGVSATVGTLSYPIAVALSKEDAKDAKPRFLYVASSNFDLAFSTGSVQSYSLAQLDMYIDEQRCRARENPRNAGLDGGVTVVADNTVGGAATTDGGVASDAGASAPGTIALPADYGFTSAYGNARGVLCDGRDDATTWQFDPSEVAKPGQLPPKVYCCFEPRNKLDDIRVDERQIDSFASGIGVAPAGDRLYVPISSRAALVYIDVNADGKLDCDGETGRCRRGPDPSSKDDDPDHEFPGQPASMRVGTLGELGVTDGAGAADGTVFIATGHELGGFGLFVDRGAHLPDGGVPEPDGGAPVLQSAISGLPNRPTSLVLNAAEKLLYVTNAGDINYLTRIGVRDGNEGAADKRDLLYRTSQVTVTGFAQSRDIRDVAFDPRDPKRVYALVRGLQESVAFLERDSALAQNARLVDSVRVGAGPSKIEFIEIDGRAFLLVSCYDARSVFVIDADQREVVSVVRNLAGPFTMTYDSARKYLYVADFRASVVRVVDLAGVTDKRTPPPRIIATLGLPRFQGGLK